MPQGAQTAATPGNGAATYQEVRDASQLSDEEILGIDVDSVAPPLPAQAGFRPAGVPPSEENATGLKPGATQDQPDSQGGDSQTIAEIFPGGVATARAAAESAEQLAKLDAAYFSSDAKKQAELAAYLYSAEPRAFAAMVEHAARVLAERDPAAFAIAAKAFASTGPGTGVVGAPLGAPRDGFSRNQERAASSTPTNLADPAQQRTREPTDVTRERADIAHAKTEIDRERQQLRVEKFEAFQRNANDAVVVQVRKTLDATLTKALPENVNAAARERIAQSIFTEVHGALANDRGLAQQVASVIAQERYDAAAREQVAALVLARVRAVMPEIARRIVGEWTSGVVASHRQRAEKQDAAARRVELTGAGGAENVPQSVPSPAELRRMSDEEILDY